jgi:ribulose-phosphate 3-epimerase
MADQMAKLARVFEIAGGRADIEVDGGLDDATVVECAKHGANAIVAGSYVFKQKDLAVPIRALREGWERGRGAASAR